jgi:hypothetical protein
VTPQRYIHVRNWDRYQHPDVTRASRPAPWIKDHVQQLGEDAYYALTYRQRGILQGIRLLYAANRGSGLGWNLAGLGRRLGQEPVRARDIEALNHAGFIVISASKTQAERLHDASEDVDVDVDVEKTLAPEAPEGSSGDFLDGLEDELSQRRTKGKGSRDEKSGTPDSRSIPAGLGSTGAKGGEERQRPRDPVWDALTVLFGAVAEKTNAHGRRNKAAADLRRLQATPELLRRAAARWPTLYPQATLTDVALATHYPQLAQGMRPAVAACPTCGVGGGAHLADCERARPALDLEGLEDFRDETEAA